MEFIKPVPYCSPTLLQWIPFYYNSQFDYIESNCHSSFFFFSLPLSSYLPSFRLLDDTLSTFKDLLINSPLITYGNKLSDSWTVLQGSFCLSLFTRLVQKRSLQSSHLIIALQFTFQQIFKTQLRCHQHTTHRHTHDEGTRANCTLFCNCLISKNVYLVPLLRPRI